MERTISLNLPHRLEKAEVRRRIDQAVADLHARFASKLADIEQNWTGERMDFVLAVMGQRVAGWLEVRDESVYLEIALPWVFAMFAEALRPQLQREAARRLEHQPPAAD